MEFPVDQVIDELNHALVHQRRAVLQAPPGAGKTTRVPMALLCEPWLDKKKILMLEPRRLAVRSCAAYMADRLNEPVGQTIGYRVRMDKKVSSATRIEVVTQGIFIRMIQNDPALEGVGLVIFDEFHERNLANDLGFALCLDASEAFCEHLSVLVMSATMDHKAVSDLMDQAPVIRSQGRSFEVETVYLKSTDRMNR
ncbi:MAG: DEAD/DEAH box helicase, partial [Desulfobacterales bacterium]|nr:DEAD/DEAH box helicase [Desulfobacterales bacterium]